MTVHFDMKFAGQAISSLSLIISLLLTLNSCSDHEAGSENAAMAGSDAELAVIMRQIHDDAKLMHRTIKNGERISGPLPEYLGRITHAKTTDSTVGGPVFEAFAQTYTQNIESIYSDTANSKELFNASVNTCIDCHREFCPGPVKTIQKLKLK